jgi:hypothetical protein
MTPRNYLVAAGLIAAGVVLAGCNGPNPATAANAAANATKDEIKAGQVVPANGTGSNKVVLTMGTADRLGILTAPVQEVMTAVAGESAPTVHKVLPMAAVFYDKNGATWVYTNPEPLTYVRQLVSVVRIDGDLAVLQSGPATGIAVVTRGTPELAGIEDGVAGE